MLTDGCMLGWRDILVRCNRSRAVPFLMAFYFYVGLVSLSGVVAQEEDAKVHSEYLRDKEKMYECIADTGATMLLSIRNVIAKNQKLINRDPETGNYYFKGFVPAVVGSRVANDFSLRTGYKLKQTALRVRNPRNSPDEWEERTLKVLERDRTEKGFGEITEIEGVEVYRYMKPLYMEKECLMCHSSPEAMPPGVKAYIERNYGNDQAMGYKEGDLRGGISVIIPIPEMSGP